MSKQNLCIFCHKINCKVLSTSQYFFVIRDTAYPVTKHHTLIITNRHVSDYFELNNEELIKLHKKYYKCWPKDYKDILDSY